MTEGTEAFCLQYLLRREEIAEIARRLADAHDEDLVQNADMFDIHRPTISGNKHPNRTMRLLEEDLIKKDIPLLCMLEALCETGMELTQGLISCPVPGDLVKFAARLYELLTGDPPPATRLAVSLTEIKAQHALKRLTAAMREMDAYIRP